MSQPDTPKSELGKKLYALMPEVYRNRDKNNDRDLAKYLDTCGELLDLIHQTLVQRLADSFPDNPMGEKALACQDWLIPYFADLLDVQLVSPHVEGQRDEVANAIGWRQRKGTPVVAEEVAEAVGQQEKGLAEVELQEGFQRVAMTPRIGFPLLPESAFGKKPMDKRNPSEAARHPGLPVVTIDFRCVSRAVESKLDNPSSQQSLFNGKLIVWRQVNPRGAPCFPNSYEDVSPRIVDMRTPDWCRGHFHPRHVLLFAPPPTGFFPQDQTRFEWNERDKPEHKDIHLSETEKGEIYHIYNPSHNPSNKANSNVRPIAVTVTTSPPTFDGGKIYSIEHLSFDASIRVSNGRLVLRNVAAKKALVTTPVSAEVMLDAKDCLFDEIEVEHGTVRLEYCTVMRKLTCKHLQASDCILPDEVGDNVTGCVRYSRVPQSLLDQPEEALLRHKPSVTTDQPVFFGFKTCKETGDVSTFGNPGYGVLHPATPPSICFGAEDDGEMGAYHERQYCLQTAAVLDKLQDFLPLGIEAILIQDTRLLHVPPEQPISKKSTYNGEES
jgi:hypothetical protein